jgi:hypothetical protein
MKRSWLFGLVITLGLGAAVISSGCFDAPPLSTTTTTTRETTTTGPAVEAPPPAVTQQSTTTTYGAPDGSVTRERTTYSTP